MKYVWTPFIWLWKYIIVPIIGVRMEPESPWHDPRLDELWKKGWFYGWYLHLPYDVYRNLPMKTINRSEWYILSKELPFTPRKEYHPSFDPAEREVGHDENFRYRVPS